jgi:hypothetical protein
MEVDDVETDPDWVRQMGRLAACELILIARPGVEIKPNRNFSEQSEFPFELSYKVTKSPLEGTKTLSGATR